MLTEIKETTSDWIVMFSAAGYFIGREIVETGLPYDRRSGYFKSRGEAEQELCSYGGHNERNGICQSCNKLIFPRKWLNSQLGRADKEIYSTLREAAFSKSEWRSIERILNHPFDAQEKMTKIRKLKIVSSILSSLKNLPTRHIFEPTDTEGKTMECTRCRRSISYGTQEWDLAVDGECNPF